MMKAVLENRTGMQSHGNDRALGLFLELRQSHITQSPRARTQLSILAKHGFPSSLSIGWALHLCQLKLYQFFKALLKTPYLNFPIFSQLETVCSFSKITKHLLCASVTVPPCNKSVVTYLMGFPGGTSAKEPACQRRGCKRRSFNPGLGRPTGGGHGNPPQYFCLENLMDRGAWRATVHMVTNSRTRTKRLSMRVSYAPYMLPKPLKGRVHMSD